MNIFWFCLVLIVPLSGLSYIFWHLWTLLPQGLVFKSMVLLLGLCCFLLLFVSLSRWIDELPISLSRAVYEIGTSSIIVMLYLVLFFLLLDLGRICGVVPRSWLYANGHMALALLLFVCGLLTYGNIRYRHKVRVPLTMVSGKSLHGSCRILMVSDLHLGYSNGRKELARWVDLMNAEHPDVILIAGDIVDRSMRPLLEVHMADEFLRLQAPVYACLGNHEYYSGRERSEQFYREANIHLLRDETAAVGKRLVVVGRDDRMNPHRKPLGELLKSVDRSNFILLLDHQPTDLNKAEMAGVDFQFSGHTHRGQVWPISWMTDLLFECSWGTHRRGQTQYYVSSGLGIWGGKFRIGTQSEYLVLTLH